MATVLRQTPFPAGGASVSSVAITSTPALGDTYAQGESIEVTVTWNTDVTWDVLAANNADLRVRLDIGGSTQVAKLGRGGATAGAGRSLVFSYTVQSGDSDTDGIFPKPSVAGHMVQLVHGATLQGAGGVDADRKHAALAADAGHKVGGATTATADAGADQEVTPGATVTLMGSGSSGISGASLSYAWTQTSGDTVTLSSATAQNPTFTAPSLTADPNLQFSLVVNDGTNPSAADTVQVLVRPPLNPASAPCAHPAPAGTVFQTIDLWDITGTTDSSITYRPKSSGLQATDVYFCRPDGTRETHATGININNTRTVSGLSSGTTYWMAARFYTVGETNYVWKGWVAVTTTGGASILQVEFTSSPSSGDTYGIGETIQVQVTWSQNVTVANGGDNANVSLRLDLGADDSDLTNSRRKMAYASGSGTDTLTFEYTVQAGTTDIDNDGVWLQTASDAVVFLESGATLTGGNPSTNNALLTRSGLSTSGDATRKVDGSTTATADAGEDQEVLTGATVTLDGSGSSSTIQSATLSYQWTQTSGDTVTLDTTNPATPTFTAPSLTADPNLEFSLTVNDGNLDSAPDTVQVTVRPPLNPASAPCAHPIAAGEHLVFSDQFEVTATSDSSISYRGFATGGLTNDLYFCWPDGTRELRAENVVNHTETVSGLSSGTTYWVTGNSSDRITTIWNRWRAVTTTGGATLLDVGFTSSPSLGDTYGIGETIRAQVAWSQAVTVANGGDDANVSLRLDLGTDDTDLTNSRRKMAYVSGSRARTH